MLPSKSFEPEVISKKPKRFYFPDININYSFSTLEKIAKDKGVNFKQGDIVIADNPRKNRRKVYRKTNDGDVLVYALLNKDNKFIPLKHKERLESRSMLGYFEY